MKGLLYWRFACLFLGTLFSFARASEFCLSPEIARKHVMMVNQRGQHIDPAQEWDLLEGKEDWNYAETIKAIRTGIQEYCRSFRQTNHTAEIQVVVFVHGGLNSYSASKRRLKRMLSDENRMLAEGYYPLLIVWNSDFVSSYFEHLLYIRQGEVWTTMGKVTAPFMFAVDVARGLARLPLTLGGRWLNDWRTIDPPGSKRSKTAAWEDMEARLEDWQKRAYPEAAGNRLIRKPEPEREARSDAERAFRFACYILTQPTKIAVLPLADGLAGEAWDNMIRRTRTMFEPPETYDFPVDYRKAFLTNQDPAQLQAKVDQWMAPREPVIRARSTRQARLKVAPDGSMYDFARQLSFWSTNQVFPKDLKWQFVGHSMGTMVLNELFRVAPDIRAKRVTYMAAACSIRDFQESIVPYLRRQALIHSNAIPFYNLSLHRIRERDNSMDKVDIIPRGTLLNYIDDIFSKPATITDRTLGSWENIIRALPDLPRDLRPQIHNVCFDILPWTFSSGSTNQPQNHSSFTVDFAFWKEEFVRGPHSNIAAEAVAEPEIPKPTRQFRQSPPMKK
jgi:pimeloyl-ACP methyl ester carboxylesterase